MAKHLGSALRLSGQIVDLFHPDQLPQPDDFLPTPRTSDVNGPWLNRPSGGQDLRTTVALLEHDSWGKFADAIARWEQVLGRPAPEPTEATGRGGRYRLSPRFVEWMMGLPEGWVTDIDISRAAKLRALGNGVMPQQAVVALEDMVTAFEYGDLEQEAA